MRPIPYLKGLDILRFLAATLVILAHAHYHLAQLGIAWHDHQIIMYLGGVSVAFFFTLSGFLISALGMQEQTRHGRFYVKKFYFRRMLRIWPLYYLTVLLSLLFIFILLPVYFPLAENRFPMPVSLLCALFFIPNYLVVNGLTSFGAINGLWSIGVEEAFYLLFPLLLLLQKKIKSYIVIFGAALAIFLLFRVSLLYSWAGFPLTIKNFLGTYSFHYMLVGCVFAAIWIKYRGNRNAQRRFNIIALLLGLATGVWFVKGIATPPLVTGMVKAVLFSSIILLTAQAGDRFWGNSPLVYLGKISYGLYVFHPFVSYFLRFCCARYGPVMKLVKQMPSLYFIFLLGLTIVVAHFSYRFYERRFLRYKDKLEVA